MNPSQMSERDQITEGKGVVAQSLDKTLLVLTGGAFGFSLAYLTYLPSIIPIKYLNKLLIAWGLWGGLISLLLLGLAASWFAYDTMIDHMDGKTKKEPIPSICFIKVINLSGPVLFIIGGIFFGYFVWETSIYKPG